MYRIFVTIGWCVHVFLFIPYCSTLLPIVHCRKNEQKDQLILWPTLQLIRAQQVQRMGTINLHRNIEQMMMMTLMVDVSFFSFSLSFFFFVDVRNNVCQLSTIQTYPYPPPSPRPIAISFLASVHSFPLFIVQLCLLAATRDFVLKKYHLIIRTWYINKLIPLVTTHSSAVIENVWNPHTVLVLWDSGYCPYIQ